MHPFFEPTQNWKIFCGNYFIYQVEYNLCSFVVVYITVWDQIIKWEIPTITLISKTLPHFCTCPNSKPGFPLPFVWFFLCSMIGRSSHLFCWYCWLSLFKLSFIIPSGQSLSLISLQCRGAPTLPVEKSVTVKEKINKQPFNLCK
jgi:hypothetical protein